MQHSTSHLARVVAALLGSGLVAQASPEPYRVQASSVETSYFEVNSIPNSRTGPTQNFAGFVTPQGGDSLFEFGWLYRIAGDVENSSFNDATTTSQVLSTPGRFVPGNPPQNLNLGTMTIGWIDVDGRGFDALWDISVTERGPDRAVASHTMSVTNPGSTPLQLEVLLYLDADVDGGIINGDARAQPGASFIVSNPFTGSFVDVAADPTPQRWEVDSFAGDLDARIRASVAAPYDLANAGMPFVDDDWTGAFQWSLTVAPGRTERLTVKVGRNVCQNLSGLLGSVRHYGTALAGQNGAPTLDSLPPTVGSPYHLHVGNGPSSGTATLLIGGNLASLQFCGLDIAVLPWTTVDVPLDASGAGTLELLTPCDPNVFGFAVFTQALVIDATSPSPCFPLVHSDGFESIFGG